MKTFILNVILILFLVTNAQAQNFAKPNEGVYEINLLNMAYLVGVDMGANNYKIVLAGNQKSIGGDIKDQQWAVSANNDGSYSLKHIKSEMYLTQGTQRPILRKNPNPVQDQKWYFTHNGNNTYGIRPKNNNVYLQYLKYMDLMYDIPKNVAKVYSDDWNLVWISDLPQSSSIATATVYTNASNIEVHGIYQLFNKTNKYAVVRGANAAVTSSYQSNGEANWQPAQMAGGMYMLNSPNARKKIACIDVYNGAAVALTASSGNDVQWSIQQQADGFSYIINKATGAYLSYSKQSNGLVTTKNVDDSCKWKFQK